MSEKKLTIAELAELVGGQVDGDGSVCVTGISAIDDDAPGTVTFAADEKREARLAKTKASAAIVRRSAGPAPLPLVRVDNVQAAVAKLLGCLRDDESLPPAGVDASAVVAASAKLADGVAVGPGAVVGEQAEIGAGSVLCAGVKVGRGVRIGRDCVLRENVVVLDGCVLGERVRIWPNSVIGSDGLGYYFENGVHHKVPHAGNVVIEDDVEIGACTCVDRAKFGSTRIGAGTKMDNLVQIAHNVRTGRVCMLAAHVGIAGSAELGDYVVLMGHCGIRDNIRLGSGVQSGAFTAAAHDVPDGKVVLGIPARDVREQLRILKAEEKLPELLKRVRALELRLEKLESPKDH